MSVVSDSGDPAGEQSEAPLPPEALPDFAASAAMMQDILSVDSDRTEPVVPTQPAPEPVATTGSGAPASDEIEEPVAASSEPPIAPDLFPPAKPKAKRRFWR